MKRARDRFTAISVRANGQSFKVTNTGAGQLQAVVSGDRCSDDCPTRGREGVQDRAFILHARWRSADPAKAKQNQRFAVVLRITEPQPQYGRLIVADYLPAGFEIDNPRLVSSGDTGTLAWIANAQVPSYSEFRDDRFSAAFERKAGDPVVFTVAYVVRAVSPGRYTLPQAYVEDMYRPDRYGRTETGHRGPGGEIGSAMKRWRIILAVAVAQRSLRCRRCVGCFFGPLRALMKPNIPRLS